MEELKKQCTKCKRILPYTNFRWKNKAEGKLHSQCKECEKQADKIHYQESKERQDSVKSRVYQRKENNLKIVNEARANGCVKCGEKRICCLDFHHLNKEEKKMEIAYMTARCSTENLIKELKKCIVLCSNCHREFHYLEKEQNLTIQEYLAE